MKVVLREKGKKRFLMRISQQIDCLLLDAALL